MMNKFIFNFECPKCGLYDFHESDTEDIGILKCPRCKQEIKVYTEDFAKIHCPNCNIRFDATVINKCNIIRCRNCKSPVDLTYKKRKGYYVSGKRR